MFQKLKNKQGVTILMALLFLLVAVMVSCIIVAAAVTALRTIRYERQQQQAYLTVSSAAQLLVEQISTAQAKMGTQKRYTDSTKTVLVKTEPVLVYPDNTQFPNVWKTAMLGLQTNETAADTFTIEVEGMDAVTVDFTLTQKFAITAVVYNDLCCMVVQVQSNDPVRHTENGSISDGTEAKYYESEYYAYSWNASNVVITKRGGTTE